MERYFPKAAAVLLLLLLSGSGPGCQGQSTSDTRTTPVVQKNRQQSPRRAESPPSAERRKNQDTDKKLVKESWFALYMSNSKIGHGRSRIVSLKRAGEPLVRIENEQQISIHRGGDRVDQTIRTQSLERPNGDVLELHTEVLGAGTAVITHAVRKGNQLEIAFTTDGKTTSTSIDWMPQWRGFDAEQQILRAKLPEPGDVITFSSLLPVFNVVAETRMMVKKWENVDARFGCRPPFNERGHEQRLFRPTFRWRKGDR
jgi:hypothetical protein